VTDERLSLYHRFSCLAQPFVFERLIRKELFMAISKELLDILACPKCKGDIHLNPGGDGLICDACRLMYPIKDDIPVMLIDEAVQL
jgi:uncharacterized protein YbaR (Trm112 family)